MEPILGQSCGGCVSVSQGASLSSTAYSTTRSTDVSYKINWLFSSNFTLLTKRKQIRWKSNTVPHLQYMTVCEIIFFLQFSLYDLKFKSKLTEYMNIKQGYKCKCCPYVLNFCTMRQPCNNKRKSKHLGTRLRITANVSLMMSNIQNPYTTITEVKAATNSNGDKNWTNSIKMHKLKWAWK